MNEFDVYKKFKVFFDRFPERKYIIFKYLPLCKGNVLNVGVHNFNRYDGKCCKNVKYETIDVVEDCRKYGSSFKHTTIDFLDYSPNYKFNHIILFGVLGISKADGMEYSLHLKENKIIKKIDELLELNGTVLLGPDVVENRSHSSLNNYSNVTFWNNIIKNNEILKNKYVVEENFKGRANMIIVLKKIL